MGCECLHGKYPLMKAAAAPTTLEEGFLFNRRKTHVFFVVYVVTSVSSHLTHKPPPTYPTLLFLGCSL